MDRRTRHSTTFRNLNYNFCFLLLLLVSCRINLAKSSSSTESFLKTSLASKQIDRRIDTEFITAETKFNEDNKAVYTGSYFKAGVCNEKNCYMPNGRCENDNLCACNVGYAQLPDTKTTEEEPSCATRLKSQAIFFALELLTWIGIGHFYAGRLAYGFAKLSVFIFIIVLDITIKRFINAKNKNFFIMLSYALYASFLLWETIDIILIGSNLFRDGNGFEIMTWEK